MILKQNEIDVITELQTQEKNCVEKYRLITARSSSKRRDPTYIFCMRFQVAKTQCNRTAMAQKINRQTAGDHLSNDCCPCCSGHAPLKTKYK